MRRTSILCRRAGAIGWSLPKKLALEPSVVLSRGDGPKADASSLTLGLEAMHNGSDMDLAAYGRFLEQVSDDHAIGGAIQEAFILAAERAGILFGE